MRKILSIFQLKINLVSLMKNMIKVVDDFDNKILIFILLFFYYFIYIYYNYLYLL